MNFDNPTGKKTNAKRGVLELVAEILNALSQESLRKTHITFRCNLDSRAVTKYLNALKKMGLVSENEDSDKHFHISSRGRDYLKKYSELVSIMNIDNGENSMQINPLN